jgi:hypothetical protein
MPLAVDAAEDTGVSLLATSNRHKDQRSEEKKPKYKNLR